MFPNVTKPANSKRVRISRRRKPLFAFGIAFLLFLSLVVYAGNLEPPGPPGPTMRTLDEIYDLLLSIFERQEATAGPESVGSESRLTGCLEVVPPGGTPPLLASTDPADIADPICGQLDGEPVRQRIVAADQVITTNYVPPGLGSFQDQHGPFVITKNVDVISPILLQYLVESTSLPEVRFRWYRDNPNFQEPEQYMTVTLFDARVVDYNQTVLPTPDGFRHVEDVAFSYATIEWLHADSTNTQDSPD